MERLKCVICGKEIEDHGRRYCKACRKEAYKASSRKWKEKQYHIIPEVGYESLASAILQQACRDYGVAEYHAEVVRFFKSNRCQTITGADGTDVLSKLEKKYAGKTKRGSVSKEAASEVREKTEEPERGLCR